MVGNDGQSVASAAGSDAGPQTSQQHQSYNNNHDSFLSSMTFAAANGRGNEDVFSTDAGVCDCDECGSIRKTIIPESIRAAVQNHKRQRTLKRTQDRRLVNRSEDVAVWSWTLPIDAEPLVEFGNENCHRLIWIQRLPGSLKQIGTGIIGSSMEENGRITLDWMEGDVLYVPGRNGKAVGWVHVAKEQQTGTGPAVIHIAKITKNTKDTLTDQEEGKMGPLWLESIRSICDRTIHISKKTKHDDGTIAHRLVPGEAEIFQLTIKNLLKQSDPFR
jgi:hypothetical protein